ncbi:MAG: hypothetical protein ACI9S8_002601 [Chlamydiales bacterium]|jgi:hypothetical protein
MVNETSIGEYQKIVGCYQDVGGILEREEACEKLEDVDSLEQRLVFACRVWGECHNSIEEILEKRFKFSDKSVEHLLLTLEARNLCNTAEKVHKVVASYSTQLYKAQKKKNTGGFGRVRQCIARSIVWRGAVTVVYWGANACLNPLNVGMGWAGKLIIIQGAATANPPLVVLGTGIYIASFYNFNPMIMRICSATKKVVFRKEIGRKELARIFRAKEILERNDDRSLRLGFQHCLVQMEPIKAYSVP